MRLNRNLILLVLCFVAICSAKKLKDEDFSEFDDFDQDEFDAGAETASTTSIPSTKINHDQVDNDFPDTKQDDVTINDGNDDDDDAMFDDEEFEAPDAFPTSSPSTPDLKIAEVPANLTGNSWEAYHCEAIMLIILLGYLINFLIGRTKNARLANLIFHSQQDLLAKNFSLVGDNGQTRTNPAEEQITSMQKETENLYILWCSGRTAVESMLMEIRFVKRQCLFNSLAAMLKSVNDTLVYTIDFGKDELETLVFCLARKRSAARLHRDMLDLSQFCSEKKNADKKGLNGNYQVLSEIGEVTTSILDNRVVDFIDKYPDALEYIHVSDQYMGMKNQNPDQPNQNASQQQDALNVNERTVRRVLIVAFNLLPQNDRSLSVTCEVATNDYLRLVFYLIDRLNTFRLASKEAKMKAIKNRQRIEEQFLKNVNLQRQEQAQQRREEKRRAEKEKVMQSDDPELQRKWEEKEHKKEMKRRQPKMKQMKVKSM